MKNRAGNHKTNLSGKFAYKSFFPAKLPPDPKLQIDDKTLKLLVEANKQIAILDNLTEKIPDIHLFISMYVRKEALMSSQIEGTQASLDDVLDPEISENTNSDVTDVISYIKATDFALEKLKTLPLCNRLIKETHGILMQGARGQEKSPGEFRVSQNWIGGHGSTLNTARYIPPSPEDMAGSISDLEKYLHSEDDTDVLIRAALIHYQFESIHPFLDGNGRIGRLLIILFLIQEKLLKVPALYISYFLKRNRVEYYDRMMEVRDSGNFEQWVAFFLEAVLQSAKDAIETIYALDELRKINTEKIKKQGRAASSMLNLLSYLEGKPIIAIKQTAEDLKLSFVSISRTIEKLIKLDILVQNETKRRNRTFSYEDYLKILRKDT